MMTICTALAIVALLSIYFLGLGKPEDYVIRGFDTHPFFFVGCMAILVVHFHCLTGFVWAWMDSGNIEPAWCRTISLLFLWAFLIPPELMMRLRGATSARLGGFDLAMLNEIGFFFLLGMLLLWSLVFIVWVWDGVRFLFG